MKLPLFTSHYSYGKSLLTLEKKENSSLTGADSIIDLVLDKKIKDIYLIEDNMSGFLQAYESCKDTELNLRFGLRMMMTNDLTKKDEDSLKSNHKLIIFALNTQGYFDLIRIYSRAACEGKYYVPRMDYKVLKELWTKNLAVAIPFYDSFLYNNNLLGGNSVPDLFFKNPIFFIEQNGLPIDDLMRGIVQDFCFSDKGPKIQEVQTIYYTKRADFKAYNVFRCIDNRSTLDKPQLEGFCSDTFCLEHCYE